MATKKHQPHTKDKPAPMPPEGKENIPPEDAANQAAVEGKSDIEKQLDAAADARNATGGQSGHGSHLTSGLAATDETQTAEELAGTDHPKAPEVPLETPDKEEK